MTTFLVILVGIIIILTITDMILTSRRRKYLIQLAEKSNEIVNEYTSQLIANANIITESKEEILIAKNKIDRFVVDYPGTMDKHNLEIAQIFSILENLDTKKE